MEKSFPKEMRHFFFPFFLIFGALFERLVLQAPWELWAVLRICWRGGGSILVFWKICCILPRKVQFYWMLPTGSSRLSLDHSWHSFAPFGFCFPSGNCFLFFILVFFCFWNKNCCMLTQKDQNRINVTGRSDIRSDFHIEYRAIGLFIIC